MTTATSGAFEPYKLTTPSSRLQLEVLPYGFTFHSLKVNVGGTSRELLVGPVDPAEHGQARRFLNPIIGRYANRLPSGRTERDGVVLELEGENGVTLHGGKEGWDAKVWTKVDRSASKLFPDGDFRYPPTPADQGSDVIYQLTSAAGEGGFPLKVVCEALVSVLEDTEATKSLGSVRYVLRAVVEDDGSDSKEELAAGTPLNLTMHTGFNLNAEGKAQGDVSKHQLWINSWNVVETDEAMLPTGELVCTLSGKPSEDLGYLKGAWNEFKAHRRLDEEPVPKSIDHNYMLNGAPPTEPQAVVTAPDSSLSLLFRTNQTSVQVYYPTDAVFLEFHQPLATFLHLQLQRHAGTDTILRTGEVYENMVEIEAVESLSS